MNNANVQQLHKSMQAVKKGIYTMQGFAFEKLIHEIILDNGTFKNGSFVVKLSDLSLSEKKLLLSHVLEADEYEEACERPVLAEQLFKEREDFFWKAIDRECDEVYRDVMEERRQYA